MIFFSIDNLASQAKMYTKYLNKFKILKTNNYNNQWFKLQLPKPGDRSNLHLQDLLIMLL